MDYAGLVLFLVTVVFLSFMVVTFMFVIVTFMVMVVVVMRFMIVVVMVSQTILFGGVRAGGCEESYDCSTQYYI